MFAHQILEDLEKHSPVENNNYYNALKIMATNLIKKSQKFHIGEYKKLNDLFLSHAEGKIRLFQDNASELKLPYSTIYLDGTVDAPPDDGDVAVPRRAIVVSSINPPDDTFWMYFGFDFIDDKKLFNLIGKKIWTMSSLVFIIHIGDPIPVFEFGKFLGSSGLLKNYENKTQLAQFLPFYALGPELAALFTKEQTAKMVEDQYYDFNTLNAFLMLLNCKNVGSTIINPSPNLNKKRKKFGKQELFSYKILKLELPGEKKKSIVTEKEAMTHYRLHFCRGHFKTYTKEKPLLGHGVGRYWFSATLRGQNKDGFVMKDYIVETK